MDVHVLTWTFDVLLAQLGRRPADMLGMLDFERLDVYQCSLRLSAAAFAIAGGKARGNVDLADQLRRAATSVPLNIAEGAGKTSGRDRGRFFAIARGSTMECAAIIDVLRLQGLVDPDGASEAKDLAVRVVSMLSKMCR